MLATLTMMLFAVYVNFLDVPSLLAPRSNLIEYQFFVANLLLFGYVWSLVLFSFSACVSQLLAYYLQVLRLEPKWSRLHCDRFFVVPPQARAHAKQRDNYLN